MKILGIFIVIFDLIKNLNIEKIYRKIKHQILVQSWWRAIIMILFAGFIGAMYSIYLAYLLIFIVTLLLNIYQKKYAKQRHEWDKYSGNEHLILPTLTVVLLLSFTYIASIKIGVPKYTVIKEITLSNETVTNHSFVYIDINGKILELHTGSGCKMGHKALIYRENINNSYINTDFNSNYYLDCYKSIKKIIKIRQ